MKFVCDHAGDEAYCGGCPLATPKETTLEHDEVACTVEPDYTVKLIPVE